MSEKILKRVIQVSVILLAVWIIANINIDTLIGVVCAPIVVYVFYCIITGKFKIVYTSSRPKEYKGPMTSTTHPFGWMRDKTWVPGHGYRDAQGNYYDYNGIPRVTPVDVKDD